MKARRVRGLDVEGAAAENLRRVVAVRLDELESLVPRALDPGEREAQHDLRIAAKRLRYVLELSAPALGPAAAKGAKRARRLQDVLGELRDCDELIERAEAQVARLREEDAAALLAARRDGAGDLDASAARGAPNRTAYRGLEVLIAYLTARRVALFERFAELSAVAPVPRGALDGGAS